MKNTTYKLAFILFTFLAITSCGDDDEPAVINEEETITKVRLTVTKKDSSTSKTYDWTASSKPDITLEPNTSYRVEAQFLDESDPNDVEDITKEVIKEKDEHFVFYDTTVSGLTFDSATGDTIDSNKIPINLVTLWKTTGETNGVVKIFLIHEPTTKSGDSRDDFGGETDIEVDFKVTIKK